MSETLFDIICGIGSSPAAEVASLRGWARANKGIAGARRVLLIDSAYTREQGIGERVRAALCEVLSLDVNHIALECFSNKPGIDELMRIYTGWRGRADATNLLFCSQPGLAFLNVQLFARLPDATQIVFNEGPSVCYGRFEGGEGFKKTPIPALGVDMVLGLHAATCKAQADWPQFLAAEQRAALTGFVQEHNGYCNAEVTSAAGGKTSLHGLWENRGRLFGALLADPGRDTQEVRLQAQEIATLRPLQITVALISANKDQRETWNWFGLPAVTHVTKLERHPALALPHRTALSAKDEPANFQSAIAPGDHSNPVACSAWAETLNDVNLVCWMSEDPLVTLATIWTHRPKRCWLLYDKVHERVCRNVYRLLQQASKLPVGELRLAPSNRLASEVKQAIAPQKTIGGQWIANITPGSKTQALALATLHKDGLALYSIDNAKSAAVVLDASSPANRFARQTPPLSIVASIAGGPLRATWNAPTREDEQHAAVLLMLRILVAYYREQRKNKQRYHPIPQFYRSQNGDSIRLRRTQGERPGNGGLIREIKVKPQGGQPSVFNWKGGAWLEHLLAHALAQLDDTEVCTGFAWDWANPRPDFSKGEIDVVAAHGGSIYVFECKTGQSKKILDKGRAQAGNMAAACFGRFAIPAVIVPWIDKPKRDSFQDNPIPVICLYDLLNEKRVAATLAWLRRHPSTFKSGKVFKPICHDH